MYVNIGTPCEWHGDRVTQVDLDLDVVRNLDGTVDILDEDEFLDHQVRFCYTTTLIDGARSATEAVVALLERNAEPFVHAQQVWLRLART